MKRSAYILTALLLTLLFATVTLAGQDGIKLMKIAGGSSHLTDAAGMSLYWFKKDNAGVSNCSGGCLEKWPAFYQEKIMAPEGINSADFGTITRTDGKKQTTFRGYPLYYFANDKMAGDIKGQGLKDVWFLIDPANFPPM